MSMESEDVPSILTPALSRGTASFKGVWPPNWTITPKGFSLSIMAMTSSKVRGSKYSLSDVS